MIKNLFRRKNTEIAERQLDLEERKLKQQQKMLQLMQQEQLETPVTFAPPELMPGVVPAGRKAAIAMDSCQSIYDYSTIGDPSFYSTFLGYPTLAAMSQSSDYRSVAETTATEMTREWGRFKVDDNSGGNDEDLTDAEREKRELEEKRLKAERVDKINKLADAFKLHNIRSLVQRAIEVEYTMGRAQIYIKLKDGKDDLPFVLEPRGVKKGDLEGFRLIEPMWSTPSVYNASDPTAEDFYKPTKWFVLGREVHADRLMTLIMRPVPDMLKPAYNFGGISMFQLMKPYVERYQRTADSVAQLARAYSLTILSTDMSAILAGRDGAADLWLRAGLFNKGRDNTGLMLLDKETEDIDQVNTPLSSLPELLTKSQEQMAAPSHTPLVKLLGVTPSGLNANSDGEIRVYYDYIMAQNEAHIRPIIERISYLMQLDMFGEIDPSIVWEFNPLYQLNEKEIAETQEIKARTASLLVERGVVSELEARQALAADEDSAFNTIDVSDVPERMEYDMGLFEQAQDSDFDESKVKRDEQGRFATQESASSDQPQSGGETSEGLEKTGSEKSFVSWSIDSEELYDDEGEVVGEEDYVLIEKLWVDPSERGQGKGRELMESAIAEAQEKYPGLPIRLAALPFGEGAMEVSDLVEYYETMGFEVINTEGHAVVMELDR